MSSPTATLVAREVSKSFGPRVVLDSVSLTVPPGQPHRDRRAERHREDRRSCACSPESTLPTPASVSRLPPSATVGFLPQEPDRLAGRDAARRSSARRTGVADAHGRVRSGNRRRSPRARPAPTTATRGAGPLSRARRGRLRSSRWPRSSNASGCRPVFSTQPMPAMSGGQAARASLAAILLARFDVFLLDEPTNDLDFAGLDLLETFLARSLERSRHRVARPRLPRPHDRRCARARRAHASRPLLRGRVAGVPRGARARPPARAGGVRDVHGQAKHARRARAQQQREWAVQGVEQGQEERRDGQVHPAFPYGIERAARRQGAARPNGPWSVSKPTRSRSRGSDGSSAWRSRPPRAAATWSPASRARPCTRGGFVARPDRPRDRATASGSRSSARTAAARRPCCTHCSASSRSSSVTQRARPVGRRRPARPGS